MEPEEIREIRKILGLTQEALARIIGVSLVTVRRWEKSVSKPSPLALKELESLKAKTRRKVA